MSRRGRPRWAGAVLLVLTLSTCAGSAQAGSLFGPDGAGPRPGPALLYEPAPHAPQLSNSPPFHAAPLLVSGTDAYRDGEYIYQDYRSTTTAPIRCPDWGAR